MRNYKKTIIGFSLILGMFIASLLYPFYGDENYNEEFYIYDKQGHLIAKAPTPPTPDHLLGTDRNGQDMIYLHLYGAKFTISAAFFITFFRVLAGVSTGMIIALWLPKVKTYFKDLFLAFRYVPALVIAIFMMSPFIDRFTGIPVWTIASYQIGVLTLIAYPAIVLMTIDYIEEMQRKSFVVSSFLMGASRFHVLTKHIWPFLKSIGLLIFVQQLFSTLVILMHLGVFKAYLGGQTKGGIFTADDGVPPPETLSNEWGGLIGQNFKVMIQYPWIVLSTMFFFFFLISVTNMMKKELEGHLAYENIDFIGKIKKKKGKKILLKEKKTISTSFQFINKEQKEAGF
ncbi:ABC transporter permease subunit [Bacillus sp. JJ1609]|uniref:ABC transporter permease subunit n=1 Tax=Bacillus sp. JJ1609 TaxID=3122977 RepID=UPI00300049C4